MIQLVRPHRGPVTQWYGNTQPDGLPHAGQDYGYTDGVNIFPEVYAAADGVVLFAGDSRTLGWPNQWYVNPDFDRTDAQDSSAGNLVVIGHASGADTGYAHLQSFSVRAGDTVRAGQQIGITGTTGYSFGKHLHFFLMFRPYNYETSTYGCSDPNPYFAAGGAAIAPQGTITEEDTLSAAEVKEIKDHINAVLIGGYSWKDGKHYGIAPILEQVQRQVAGTPAAVWATPVKRAGGSVSALQELADAKSKLLGLEPVIARIDNQTDPAALADLIPDAIAQQVIDALAARLAGGAL